MVELQPIDDRRWRAIFTLPRGLVAQKAAVVGEFMDESWHPGGLALVQGTDGRWRVEVEVEAGETYQFRYLVDECHWYNDDTCPLVPNGFGSQNSLLLVPGQDNSPLPALPQAASMEAKEGKSVAGALLLASAAPSKRMGR
jgi:hypothetical protein